MIVRPHRRADADRIAEILAAGWQQSYSHFMPAAFLLPRIDPARRKTEIAAWLDEDFDPDAEAIFVAEDGGDLLGFIHMELGDKGALGASGIVNLLYVDPNAQRRGIARQLMAAGADWLLQTAAGPLVLSAFIDNPSRFAYAALGGVEAKRVMSTIDGKDIESALYLWADPKALL